MKTTIKYIGFVGLITSLITGCGNKVEVEQIKGTWIRTNALSSTTYLEKVAYYQITDSTFIATNADYGNYRLVTSEPTKYHIKGDTIYRGSGKPTHIEMIDENAMVLTWKGKEQDWWAIYQRYSGSESLELYDDLPDTMKNLLKDEVKKRNDKRELEKKRKLDNLLGKLSGRFVKELGDVKCVCEISGNKYWEFACVSTYTGDTFTRGNGTLGDFRKGRWNVVPLINQYGQEMGYVRLNIKREVVMMVTVNTPDGSSVEMYPAN